MINDQIILIGGGGHCKSCIDVIEMQNKYSISGIIDLPENIGNNVMGYSVIGCDDDLEKIALSYSNFFITIGQLKNYEKRKSIFEKLTLLGVNLPTIISPLAYVSKHSIIGKGCIVMHHAIVNAGSVIGENCIINTRSLVEHDAVIGNHCHISTGSIINGGVKVGDCTFYGSGAVSKEYIEIPAESFIKANTIVK